MIDDRQNWAGNYTYTAARFHRPENIEQLQELVARCEKLRVLGTRHSFNAIADTPYDLVSLAHFDQVIALDPDRRSVTVGAGIRYGTLCRHLDRHGYALHNLGSLPHISVAGACATATHGSGDANGNLATAVTAIELVTADGKLTTISREQHADTFAGAVVSLGGLGAVTALTLAIVPAFEIQQSVYEYLPLAQLDAHFEEIVGSAYSVSLFTDWQRPLINQVWLKRRVGDELAIAPDRFGARPAPVDRHPIAALSAENCTPQMGVAGAWYERLPHFRMDFTPSSGDELQTEYLVPRQHALAAIRAIHELRERVSPLLLISEIRTIAADDLWLSPCYGQPCVALHFTWKPRWREVRALLPVIESQLAPFDARPHWGKLFTTTPDRLRELYPRLPDFQRLLAAYDPGGKFRNPFLDAAVFGEEA